MDLIYPVGRHYNIILEINYNCYSVINKSHITAYSNYYNYYIALTVIIINHS